MQQFEVVYWQEDPWCSTYDAMCSATFTAVDEAHAMAQFDEEYRNSGTSVQCVVPK